MSWSEWSEYCVSQCGATVTYDITTLLVTTDSPLNYVFVLMFVQSLPAIFTTLSIILTTAIFCLDSLTVCCSQPSFSWSWTWRRVRRGWCWTTSLMSHTPPVLILTMMMESCSLESGGVSSWAVLETGVGRRAECHGRPGNTNTLSLTPVEQWQIYVWTGHKLYQLNTFSNLLQQPVVLVKKIGFKINKLTLESQ